MLNLTDRKSTCISTSIKLEFSENPLLSNVPGWEKGKGNNPKLDLVNVDTHTKCGQILSNHSQDIEWKQNSDLNSVKSLHKMTSNNPKLDLVNVVNVYVHTKCGQIVNYFSRY